MLPTPRRSSSSLFPSCPACGDPLPGHRATLPDGRDRWECGECGHTFTA